MEKITDQEKRGNYTAERLERLRPKAFQSCIKMLCDKWPKIEIAQTLNVTEKTVCRVADKHADKITELEKHFSKKLRRVAWDQVDRVERNPGIIPPQAIAQTVKYFFETAQLADGRPTEIIEERQQIDIYDHWRRYVAGEAIGLAGGKLPVLNGELVPALAAPGDPAGPAASGLESDVLALPTQGNLAHGSNFGSNSAAQSATAAPNAGARGGGEAGEAGAEARNDNDPQKFSANGSSHS